MRERSRLWTNSGWSTPDQITVKGFDVCTDLMGKVSFGDMAFLELTDRLPSRQESVVINAILVTLVEHGITPSALAARLTYAGAPEAMQAAVAAGLAGLGSVFVGSMEGAARVLQQALETGEKDIGALAQDIVNDHGERGVPVPGIGHHFHKPVDPRAPRLFEIAEENGFSGRYVALMKEIAAHAETTLKKPLPINATGAIGAVASELGLDWRIVRGLGVMARAVGLVGHIREEISYPMAREIKARVEEEATSHRRKT